MSACKLFVTALLATISMQASQAAPIWFIEVTTLTFPPLEATLQAGHNAQLSRVAQLLDSKCGPNLPPVVVLTGVLPDEGHASRYDLAQRRVGGARRELQRLGVPDKAMFDAVYSESQYRERWHLAPERAQAPVHSVEVELACHLK